MSITYSEGVSVDSGTQHVMCMCRIILSPVTCQALPYFSRLSRINWQDFRKKQKVIKHELFVLISSKNFVCRVSHSKNN
jgi:hypothetical protein